MAIMPMRWPRANQVAKTHYNPDNKVFPELCRSLFCSVLEACPTIMPVMWLHAKHIPVVQHADGDVAIQWLDLPGLCCCASLTLL